MKLVVSILIAILFVLISLLNDVWFFNIWMAYIFWVEGLGWVNFSFIKAFVEELLAFPGFLHTVYSEGIKSYLLEKWFIISYNMIKLSIIFIFYFIFSLIVSLSTSFFILKRDKHYLIWLSIFFYSLLMFLN